METYAQPLTPFVKVPFTTPYPVAALQPGTPLVTRSMVRQAKNTKRAKGLSKSPTLLPATSTVQPVTQPITAEQFIRQNANLRGLTMEELTVKLSKQLQKTPVRYSCILDGIALLRSFTPCATLFPDGHYALLFRDWAIIGLVWLQPDQDTPVNDLPVWHNDNRNLMRHILDLNANKVLMASRFTEDALANPDDFRDISFVRRAFDAFGIEHLDWLFLYANENISYVLEEMGEESLDDGVTGDILESYYTDYSNLANLLVTH